MSVERSAAVALIAVSGLVALLSCESPSAPETAPPAIEELPRALSRTEREILSASNEFAFRLLNEVRADLEDRKNVFLSPLSVSLVFGMVANGARGGTLDGIEEALGVGDLSREQMNEAYRDLTELLLSLDPQVQLEIANSIWVHERFDILPSFRDRVTTYYDAEATELDFSDPAATDAINAWASDHTQGRIQEVLKSIDPEEVMFLINSIYFKGSWRSEFDPRDTRPQPFHLEDGSEAMVPLMSQEDVAGLYYLGDGVAVADLPYGGSAYAMTLVVPTSGTLTELLDTFTEERWDSWVSGLGKQSREVRIPKFELSSGADLGPPLSRMGMATAFSSMEADFGDLAESSVFVNRAFQKSFIKVDEEGTEAAAVTVTGIGVTSAGPPAFTVDRPFLVAIRERLTGTIVFLGAIYDPRGSD